MKETKKYYQRLIFIITFIQLISCSESKAPKLPLDPQTLSPGWERIIISNVGYIDIPPSMEVQIGSYKDYADEFKDINDMGISDVVIQTKGANDWDVRGFKRYARILLTSEIGSPGDFLSLDSKISEKEKAEIPEINDYLKKQIVESFTGTRLSLLEWKGTRLEKINGMTCINYSYTRKIEGSTPVMVASYIFPNENKSHQLTISYRISESEFWKDDLEIALKSFRITNINNKYSEDEIISDSSCNGNQKNIISEKVNIDSLTDVKYLHSLLMNDWRKFNVPFEQFVIDMQDETNLKRLHTNLEKKWSWFKIPYFRFSSKIKESIAKTGIKNYEEQISKLTKAIEINSRDENAFFQRGKVKFDNFDWPGAVQDFSNVIEINPKYLDAYKYRGEAKYYLSDYQGSIDDYNKLIVIDPNNEEAYVNRGMAKQSLKDYRGSIIDFTRAIEINPKSALVYYLRGFSKIKIGMKESGCKDLSRAGELGYSGAYSSIEKFCN